MRRECEKRGWSSASAWTTHRFARPPPQRSMHRRRVQTCMRRLLALTTALILCLATPGFAAAFRATSAGHVRYAIRPEGAWPDPSLTATRSRVVILLPWQTALMHRLKASNRKLIVLEDKDLGNASSYPPVEGFTADGVTYTQALEQHPNWLLRDRAGQPIRCAGFPYLWAMDVGNPGFQRAWAAEVAGELKAEGWDGVFIDNVNPTIRYYHDPSDVASYPSDAAYSAAVTAA